MLKILLLLFGTLVSEGLAYNLTQYSQTDYIVISERFEIARHNDTYMTNLTVKNFKYNRTQPAVNYTWTFKMDLQTALVLDFQAYKFSSNEYRLFPITFPVNACDALARNIFGVRNLYDCGNMFRCPIKKGTYHACNWVPDYTKFPPHSPRGRYMFDIKWMYRNTEMMLGQWYFAVKDAKFSYF